MRRRVLKLLTFIALWLAPLANVLKAYWRDLVGAPGTVSDLADWRDRWWPWTMEHIITLLADHPAVWALSGIAAFLLFILSWPDIKKFFPTVGLIKVEEEKPARLGFVMRSYPPFVDSTVTTPDDGAIQLP